MKSTFVTYSFLYLRLMFPDVILFSPERLVYCCLKVLINMVWLKRPKKILAITKCTAFESNAKKRKSKTAKP